MSVFFCYIYIRRHTADVWCGTNESKVLNLKKKKKKKKGKRVAKRKNFLVHETC